MLAAGCTRGGEENLGHVGSDVVGGSGLEEVLEAVRAVPGMGSAVRRDRCLGGCLHMQRLQETRQRVAERAQGWMPLLGGPGLAATARTPEIKAWFPSFLP